MAERKNAAPTFADAVTYDLGGPRTSELLKKLDNAIPWEKIAQPVRRLPEYRNTGAGRPTWSAVLMVKALMLAKWFNLSDPQLEECLQDRLSFRRFVGLSLQDATPDETSFVRFRQRLREARLHEKIFRLVVEHLDGHGVLVKQGTLVDATIVEAPKGVKRDDGTSTRDPDVTRTVKHGRQYHGYKGHIAMDRSRVVTGWRFTTAKEHDGHSMDQLTQNEKVLVAGDSQYDSRARREAMKARGLIPMIAYQRRRGQKELLEWKQGWNLAVATVRASVEHTFAMLKQHMGYRRTRYRGLDRNATDFALTLTALNMRRAVSLLDQ